MPACTDVAGEPLMVGAWFVVVAADTVMVKAGSDAVALPSVTEITMPGYVPTCNAAGVPESWPLEVLNEAQAGLPEML